jgi:peroxiredoxin Q/BCP
MKKYNYCLCGIAAMALVFTATPAWAKLPLEVGDTAPIFTAQDQDGTKWKLKDDIGRNIVLLYFYPKDNTPGCTAEACGFRDKLTDLKQKGVDVVGVSFDNADSHKQFIFKYNINFPLLVDTNGKIADAYGTRRSAGRNMDRRVSFLIALDGKIFHITDSPDAAVHLSEMQQAIAQLEKIDKTSSP